MHLSLNIYEYTSWIDPRLVFVNNTNISASLRSTRIDFTNWRYQIWYPEISYTEESSSTNSSEICYLYPNGTVVHYRKLALTLTCEFSYQNIPNDHDECETVAYIQNEFTDAAVLNWIDKFNSHRNQTYQTWSVELVFD